MDPKATVASKRAFFLLTRQAIKEGLRSREIDSRLTFNVGDTAVRLNCAGFYEYEGRVCRIVYVSQDEVEERKAEAEPDELEALRIGGWVAAHYYANSPKGLRLYYHAFVSDEPGAEICTSWYREFPLAPEDEIRGLVARRTQRIGLAASAQLVENVLMPGPIIRKF